MKNWLRKIKSNLWKALAFIASIPAAIWILLRWSMIGVALATIPVEGFIEKYFQFTKVQSKFIGFGIFAILLAVSWWSAEIIVVLAALALAAEVGILGSKIKARFSNPIQEVICEEA